MHKLRQSNLTLQNTIDSEIYRKYILCYWNYFNNWISIFIADHNGKDIQNVLIQYIFEKDEHEVVSKKPHGNSKAENPFQRIMPSVGEKIKESFSGHKIPVKSCLDNLYTDFGDVTQARSASNLPRGEEIPIAWNS